MRFVLFAVWDGRARPLRSWPAQNSLSSILARVATETLSFFSAASASTSKFSQCTYNELALSPKISYVTMIHNFLSTACKLRWHTFTVNILLTIHATYSSINEYILYRASDYEKYHISGPLKLKDQFLVLD